MKLVALALVLVSSCAAMSSSRRAIETSNAPKPIGPYSQAIVVGDQVWCAGQGGLDPATGAIVPGGIAAETKRTLDNLKAVLEAANFSLDDVVSVQVFLTDLANFKAFNDVYATYFTSKTPPARATVQVAKLPKDLAVEIALVAVRSR